MEFSSFIIRHFIIHFLRFLLMIRIAFFLVFSLMVFNACQNGQGAENDCKTKPQAMLRADMKGIAEHKFETKGSDSEEFVRFANGKTLTILQSGCEKIRQEFRFELKGAPNTDDPAFWTDQAILNLAALAVLDPQLMPLGNWVMMIREKKAVIRLAETVPLQGGFYTKIDRISSNDGVYLIIVLTNFSS
jgi:hypothetical protein